MNYTIAHSEKVFSGVVFDVRIDQVEDSSGGVRKVNVVEHNGAVALIPIEADGRILFVRQYRHPAGKVLLELPAGTLEPGEAPEVCASRECREEVGKSPGRLRRLGGFYLAPGYSTEYLHVFLATELTDSPLTPDEDERIQIVPLQPAEALEQMANATIEDAKSLAAMLLAMPILGLSF